MNNTTTLAPIFASMTEEEIAAASYLARYQGDTRKMFLSDLRIYFEWCRVNGIPPLKVKRVHIEFFARHLEEERGNAPSSVHRRLSVIKGFYRIAAADDRVSKDPTTHLKMPKVHYDETRTLGLDRIELGSLVDTARASSPIDAALVSLMGLLALRVTEACSVNVEDFSEVERGHRVLRVYGKGNKPATIPVLVPVLRTLELAAGGRTCGALILRKSGRRMDRNAAYQRIKSLARKAGLSDRVHPHTLRHAAITAALDAGAPLRDAQVFARHSDPRITNRYDRSRLNLDRHAAYLVSGFIAGAA